MKLFNKYIIAGILNKNEEPAKTFFKTTNINSTSLELGFVTITDPELEHSVKSGDVVLIRNSRKWFDAYDVKNENGKFTFIPFSDVICLVSNTTLSKKDQEDWLNNVDPSDFEVQ